MFMSIRLWVMGYAAFATHLVYGSKQYIAEVKGKKRDWKKNENETNSSMGDSHSRR